MIKVLIADDDFLVRMYLRQLIDWQSQDCELLEDASNGKNALEIIEKSNPDILITDITMPVMNGIELIQKIKQLNLTMKIAVLSCHDEFEFVKEAMKNGADEYLLKNDLNNEMLCNLIQTFKKDMQEVIAKKQQQENILQLADKGNEIMREEAIITLSHNEMPIAEQQSFLNSNGIDGVFYKCAVYYIKAVEFERLYIIAEVLKQYSKDENICLINVKNDGCYIIVDMTGINSQQEIENIRSKHITNISNRLETYAKSNFNIGISRIYQGDGSVTKAINEAKSISEYSFYDKIICDASILPEFNEYNIEISDKDYSKDEIIDRLEEFQKNFVIPSVICRFMATLDAKILPNADMPVIKKYNDCLERVKTYESTRTQKENSKNDIQHVAVHNAIEYVKEHFTEQISLADVADAVGLNSAYLSFVFKKQTDINFTEYVTKCRMEKVCNDMISSNLSLKQISEQAGFWDYRNFCKVFKKEFDCKPADYRKKNKI